jgi:magnesium-transporting ATPase (P-type)
MDKKSIYLYYYSMIIYLFGSVPFILYAVLIKPIGVMYHEKPFSMVSPVFGNFGVYEEGLLVITLVLVIVSIILFVISLLHNKSRNGKISFRTILAPVILYIFTFAVIGVALI